MNHLLNNHYPEGVGPSSAEQIPSNEQDQIDLENAWKRIEDPLDWPTRDVLEKLSIPALYELLERIESRKSIFRVIRESIRGQAALAEILGLCIHKIKGGKVTLPEALDVVTKYETIFINKLKDAGLNVEYESELSEEELKAKPALVLMTHQGGGGENFLHQTFTGLKGRLIVKDSLMKTPYVKEGLAARQAVAVQRHKLKDPELRRQELHRIAKEVVQQLASGGNMFVFFEGTRSKNGEIASSERRRAWTKDLITEIDKLWDQSDASDHEAFQKLLLVFNTKTAIPDAPEEKFFGTRFRTKGTTLSAKLVRADDLALEESDDLYDPNTIFGKARSILKEMLVKIILQRES